jgi:hypothetical protein
LYFDRSWGDELMFKQGLLAVVFCIGLLPVISGAGVIITLDGHAYDIGVTDAKTFDEFNTAGLAEDQPWWGSLSLAQEAAMLVAGELGDPRPGYLIDGPLFAYEPGTAIFGGEAIRATFFGTVAGIPGSVGGAIISPDAGDWVFAVAEKVQVPLPATLGLLVVGLAGIGYSRKRFNQVERV